MNEVKKAFSRMAFYYLLLAINIIPCASLLPDAFPTRNVSTIYLLMLCVCLILYYSHSVLKSGALSILMKAISRMALLLILLRGIKYSAFADVDVIARHTWYFYYVPILLIPQLLFYISLIVSPKEEYRIPKGWLWSLAVTAAIILLVLTNDLHQLVFIFNPQFENWNYDYDYGIMLYIINAWQYALYIAAIAVLVRKCRISSSKKNAWIILIPFAISIVMNVLLMTGKMPRINNSYIIEMPEANIFSVAIVLECCIQLGLIPTNADYGKLFRKFSISAQITDGRGAPVYLSNTAVPLTGEQFALPDNSRIGEHTVLHRMSLPGGFGFWQDDMTQLDSLNEELALAGDELAQETELIRLRNELKEKETKTQQRTLVYDTIAKRTQKQSQAISLLAETARLSGDIRVKEECRKRITLYGAYIKRFANLMLLSQECKLIQAGELGLSVSEVLRYLNLCGIPCELFVSADCTVNSSAALAAFEAFEELIESNYSYLRGVFVNLSEQDERLLFKINLENMKEHAQKNFIDELACADIMYECNQEDDIAFICFTLLKGGGAQ